MRVATLLASAFLVSYVFAVDMELLRGHRRPARGEAEADGAVSAAASSNATWETASLLQVSAGAGAGAYNGYCEICTRILQLHQRGEPDVCSGLSDTFFLTVRRAKISTRGESPADEALPPAE